MPIPFLSRVRKIAVLMVNLKGIRFKISKRFIKKLYKEERDLFIGLVPDILGLLAGFTASLLLPFIDKVQWILIVIPIMLTVRGALNGVFSGRLTTGLHLGKIKPSLKNNTDEFYSLIYCVLFMGLLNGIIGAILIGFYFMSVEMLLTAMIVLETLFFIATVFSISVTAIIGFVSYKHEIDPDAVVYPIMSTLNDIFGSFVLLMILIMLTPWNYRTLLIRGGLIMVMIVIITTIKIPKYFSNKNFRLTIKESYIGIIISLFLSTLAGLALMPLQDTLTRYPEILIILPPMMDTMGDIGSIITSKLTTRLHLGAININVRSALRFMILQDFLIIPIAIVLVTIYVVMSTITSNLSLERVKLIMSIYYSTLLIMILVVSIISVMLAITTFKYGINPDNISIPILTAMTDLLTIVTVYIIVTVWGY